MIDCEGGGGSGASVRAGVRLGVDMGSVRVGVARSDPAGLLATPLVTLRRGRTDLADLAALVAEHAAVEVVVGLPRTLADREGKAAQAATSYARRLAERLGPGVAVRLVDERLSTVRPSGTSGRMESTRARAVR